MLVNNAPDFAGEFVNDTADARTNLYNAIGAVGKAGNWSERVFADFDSMVVATEDSRKVPQTKSKISKIGNCENFF